MAVSLTPHRAPHFGHRAVLAPQSDFEGASPVGVSERNLLVLGGHHRRLFYARAVQPQAAQYQGRHHQQNETPKEESDDQL